MNKEELKKNIDHIIQFAKMNGMMEWSFVDVINEYLTTIENIDLD